MTQYSYPWTAVGGDRTRTADTAADIYGSTIPTGVIDGLVATANGANVDITAGVAMVHGRFYSSTATESIAYTANVKAYIVLRMTAADREVVLAKLDGNSSAFPTLTKTDAVYEIAIASVDSTGALAVVDTRRDLTLCGMYANPGLDSGWLTNTLTSGGYTSTARYRKVGSVVTVNYSYTGPLVSGSSATFENAVPSGFRPSYTVYAGAIGTNHVAATASLGASNGTITLINRSDGLTSGWYATFTYCV